MQLTLLSVSLRPLPRAEGPPDGGLGSQERVGRAGSVQFLVHVSLDGRQPSEQQITSVIISHCGSRSQRLQTNTFCKAIIIVPLLLK